MDNDTNMTSSVGISATRKFLVQINVDEIDEMRVSLGLPIEALGALIELHAKRMERQAGRQVLPFSTGTRVRPYQSAEITARPQRSAFIPERLFVSDAFDEWSGPWWKRLSPWFKAPLMKGASDWIINDIKIGTRSQFSQSGDIPGDMFTSRAVDSFVTFEPARVAMDIKLVVTYIGPHPLGQRFYASMVGRAIDTLPSFSRQDVL